MLVYLTTSSTNSCELETRVYKTLNHSLENIYNNLKKLTIEYMPDGDFFDRDYVKKYFTEEFFNQFSRIICRTEFGEFIVEKVKNNKYQYIFAPIHTYDNFIVCELEILELLD